MKSNPPRPARASRAAAPPLPAFDTLDKTHREMLAMLGDFSRLLDHVDENGPDEEAREIASRLFKFFSENARAHHEHEERYVFPPLLDGGDADLVAHVHRLQQDHGWLDEDWRLLAPQLEALAGGYNWYDLAALRIALPIFTKLNEEHIALEESEIYPAAKQRLKSMAEDAARGDVKH